MAAVVDQADDVVMRHRGVVLRYVDPSLPRAYHSNMETKPGDRERMAITKHRDRLLAARSEWHAMLTMTELLDMSEVARSRCRRALHVIDGALDVRGIAPTMQRLGLDDPEEPS